MNIEWIKATKCDKCGETFVVEERIIFSDILDRRKEREIRRFKCGREVENRNNFRDEWNYTCEQSDEHKAFLKRMDDIKESVRILLEKKKFKSSVIDSIVNRLNYDVYRKSFTDFKEEG